MIKKVLLIVSLIFFIFVVVIIMINNNVDELTPVDVVPVNHMQIENLSLVRILTDEGTFFHLTAGSAYFNNDEKLIHLSNTDLNMFDGVNTFINHADKGVYVINSTIVVDGNITGSWNDLTYITSPNGVFVYDFESNKGQIGDNIVLTHGPSKITANTLFYDSQAKKITFSEGVKMDIIGVN